MIDFPKLTECVIQQESAGNPKAVSGAGAVGLMQLMPETAHDIAKAMNIADYDLKDPETNRKMGEFYLNLLLDMFENVELALAAYNCGMGRVKKLIKLHGNSWESIKFYAPKETQDYVTKIMRNYDRCEL